MDSNAEHKLLPSNSSCYYINPESDQQRWDAQRTAPTVASAETASVKWQLAISEDDPDLNYL